MAEESGEILIENRLAARKAGYAIAFGVRVIDCALKDGCVKLIALLRSGG
jgi:hypothetical protein